MPTPSIRAGIRRRAARLAAGLVALALVAGCAVPTPEERRGDDPVLAEVAGGVIRESDLRARLDAMPRLTRAEFATGAGRARLLDQLIEEEILYRAALDAGVDEDETVRRQLEEHRRRVLAQAFLDRAQEEMTRVPEEEMRAYFEAHADEYVTETEIRLRILQNADSVIVARAREMALEGVQPFEELCRRFSEPHVLVEAAGLIPQWVREDRAIPWIGNHPEIHAVAFSTPEGEISEPFRSALGWHVLRVEEIREARPREFDEVRNDIEGRLRRERTARGLPELIAELRDRYDVVEHAPPGRTAEELFAAAQTAASPRERVALYEEMLERYPGDERAVEARFMLGFLLAEEIGDREAAAEHFRRVVAEHPDSDLAQSARWMLSSGAENPPALDAPAGGEEGAP